MVFLFPVAQIIHFILYFIEIILIDKVQNKIEKITWKRWFQKNGAERTFRTFQRGTISVHL